MSFIKCVYHIVFATKRRIPVIVDEHLRNVHKILYLLCKDQKAFVHRIGGSNEHVHLLVDIPSNISLSDFVKHIKQQSSIDIAQQRILSNWEGWQEGYGAFSVDYETIPVITQYIKDQHEHHKRVSFFDEYRDRLIKHGIAPDNPYMFPQ